MNIYQRLNEARKAVAYIKKDKQVQTYKAVSYDMVIAVCREQLIKNGIIVYPDQLAGVMNAQGVKSSKDGNSTVPDPMRLYEGKYAVNFVNMDDPTDRVVMNTEAHANDNGDKAPGKASTYATKTAILKMLSLETGENDESRVESTDVGDEIELINECKTLEELQTVFVTAWKENKSKSARDELTKAKDSVKKSILENQNV